MDVGLAPPSQHADGGRSGRAGTWSTAGPLRALIDTGASSSLITASGMFRLGVTPALLTPDPAGNGAGVGPARVPMHLHRFVELRVGPDVMRDPALWVASVRVVPIVDMLLGADWLQTRRVWLLVRDEADIRGAAAVSFAPHRVVTN